MRIVRADTGGSRVYADMLLSMRPSSEHMVNIGYQNYKADRDDFKAMLELMAQSHTDAIFEYEELVSPFVDELIQYTKKQQPGRCYREKYCNLPILDSFYHFYFTIAT